MASHHQNFFCGRAPESRTPRLLVPNEASLQRDSCPMRPDMIDLGADGRNSTPLWQRRCSKPLPMPYEGTVLPLVVAEAGAGFEHGDLQVMGLAGTTRLPYPAARSARFELALQPSEGCVLSIRRRAHRGLGETRTRIAGSVVRCPIHWTTRPHSRQDSNLYLTA